MGFIAMIHHETSTKVGLTISAAPVVPLALERVPFARDCFFYALSIALLYWALLDHAIVTWKQEQV